MKKIFQSIIAFFKNWFVNKPFIPVYPSGTPSQEELNRRNLIISSWNGKVGSESNIEYRRISWGGDWHKIIGPPVWAWDEIDYRVV